MNQVITFHNELLSDEKLLQELKEFFKRHKRKSFNKTNRVFQARSNGELIGVARLCIEENCHVLRSVEIKPGFRKIGIGASLLGETKAYIEANAISQVFCLPYSHLVSFYSNIGFQVVEDTDLPTFLRLRVEAYRRKMPDSSFVGMALKL